MTKLTRKERDRLQRRELIINAAEKCFAQEGYHGCTVEMVAEEAEISVGGIYNFFGGKENLYQSLIEFRVDQIHDSFTRAIACTGSPDMIIEAFIRVWVDICLTHRNFVKLYTRDRLGDKFNNHHLSI